MSLTGSNIDPIRAEIMRLENEQVFDYNAWERVLADLQAQGRTVAVADTMRRMVSVMSNQVLHVRTDLGMGGAEIDLTLVPALRKNESSLWRGRSAIEAYRDTVAAKTES